MILTNIDCFCCKKLSRNGERLKFSPMEKMEIAFEGQDYYMVLGNLDTVYVNLDTKKVSMITEDGSLIDIYNCQRIHMF